MAGYTGQISHTSPVRDDRSFVPDGTCFIFPRHDPPLKRWAIFEDDEDRRRFPATIEEACDKTDWRIRT